MIHPRSRIGVTVGVWIALALMPFLLDEWRLGQLGQLVSYGIFAMSLAFLWGQAGLMCFGHAVFFGIGGYAMTLVTKSMLPGFPATSWMGAVCAIALPALVACVAGWLMFRGRGLSGAYFSIVTLAAAVIVERLASHWGYIGGFNGLMNVPPLAIGSGAARRELVDAWPSYYAMLALALILYLVLLAVERSAVGTLLRAVRDNETRTAFFGFEPSRYKIVAFTLSAAVAGLAGALFVTQFGFVSPGLIGVPMSTDVLIWVALGGRQVLLGAFLGAVVVRSAESALSSTLAEYWLLALGALFIVTVVMFPSGLLGRILALPLPRRMRTE